MFDLTSSKLLILGIVALLVVGPKDLPILLRTIGKYVGMIKRQAAEFRAQFDEAMRETELQQLKKDVENLGQETEKALREGEQAVQSEIGAMKSDVESAMAGTPSPQVAAVADGPALDVDGFPIEHALKSTVETAAMSPAEIAAQAAASRTGA
jgi:sec-independent protein translocase protein TatB